MKYYKPDVKKPDDLSIPRHEIEESPLARIMGSGKTIYTELDREVAIDRFAEGIYSGYKSGLRELYNNEARACRTAKDMGATPEIHIRLDPNDRLFSIEGVDSLGIAVDVFDKSVKVMGITSNNNAKEIGQMGMGFASYTTLAQSIKVNTWARDTDECYSFMAENGKKFDPLPNPKMTKYGTKISGTWYETNPRTQEIIDIDEMVSHIMKLARYSKIPTYIHLSDDTSDYDSGTTVCKMYDSPEDYLMEEFYTEVDERTSRELTYEKIVKLKTDDYDFYGVIGIDKTNFGNMYSHNMNDLDNQITLVGTPIEQDSGYDSVRNTLDRSFSGWVLNIKNERKYKPTADRDRMVKGAMQSIYVEILEELKSEFEYLRLTDIADYNSKEDKIPYSNAMWHMVSNFVDDGTTESIVNTLNSHYTTAPSKSWTSLNDMMGKRDEMKKKNTAFHIVALKSLRKDMMERLDTAFGVQRIYFRLPTSDDGTERATRIHVLQQLDVVMGEAYAKDNSLKRNTNRKKGEVANVNCLVYGGYESKGYFKPTYWKPKKSFTLYNINEAVDDPKKETKNLIKVSRERWAETFSNVCGHLQFTIIKERKGLNKKIKTDVELLAEVGEIEFEVNTSKMKLKDIPHGKTIVYCDFQDKGKELEGFTLEELGLKPKDYYFISPIDKNVKNVGRFKDLIRWYFFDKTDMSNYTWKFETDGGRHVKSILADELGVSIMNGDDLEKTAGLLRIRREIATTYPYLYDIIKEAITWSTENNQDTIRELMHKHLGGIEK